MKILTLLVLLLVGAMTWQHLRYLNARRQLVEDEQPLLYPSSTFHVITFLELARPAKVDLARPAEVELARPAKVELARSAEVELARSAKVELAPATEMHDLIEKASTLRGEIEAAGGELVYAGKAAFTRSSDQIGDRAWDAVLLAHYPSREAYDGAARSDGVRKALGAFARTYSHGMKRPALTNLLLPQALLGLRVLDVIQGNWKVEELAPMPASERPDQQAQLETVVARLERLQSLNAEALVVFNLTKTGSSEQEEANRSYGLTMVKRMAALAHGPMHTGAAVTIEGDAHFDQAIIVYYPGPGYFAKLIRSRFFQGIIGDKQLGDTQAVPTVPILSQLRP
jgi:hypothetical protein